MTTRSTITIGGVTGRLLPDQTGAREEVRSTEGRVAGVYRPEDVRRLLGDPREYVEVRVMSELQSASRAVRK
jgi:hypothetical protein